MINTKISFSAKLDSNGATVLGAVVITVYVI